MFDYKSEFLLLIDKFHISDDTMRLIKSQELENAFTERLQARILEKLSDNQRNQIIKLANNHTKPEQISQTMFSMIEDIDTFVEKVFEEFKQEFLANI